MYYIFSYSVYEESSSKWSDLYCLPLATSSPLLGLRFNFLVSPDLICCLVSAVNQCGGGDALWASGTPCSSHHIVPTLRRFLLSNGPYSNWTHPFLKNENRLSQYIALTCFPQPPGDATSQNKLYMSAWILRFVRCDSTVYQHLDPNFSLLLFPNIKS